MRPRGELSSAAPRGVLLWLLCLFLVATNLSAGQGDEIFSDGFESGDFSAWTRETLRILFIGNSYTANNDLPAVVELLGASPRSYLQIEKGRVAISGGSWEDHAVNATTLNRIDQGWDDVVLQDQSLQPVFSPLTLKAAAETLDARIRATGGNTVLFTTWPRAFHDLTTQHYYPLYYNHHGEHLQASVAPVGQAWVRSLRIDPTLRLHAGDDSHPSANGTYLAACVFFAFLTGQSPVGLPDGGLNVSDAARDFLQTIAWDTVRGVRPPPPPLEVHSRLSAGAVEDFFISPDLSLGDVVGPLGGAGGGTSFDGSQFVSIPWSSKVNPTERLTFSIWAYRPDWSTPTASQQFLLSNPPSFGLYQDGVSLHASVRTVDQGEVLATLDAAGLEAGWHHFATTYDGAEVVFWRDGMVVATVAATGGLDQGAAPLAFSSLALGSQSVYPGPGAASAGFTGGALADFRLFHRALDAGEIADLVAGSGTPSAPSSSRRPLHVGG